MADRPTTYLLRDKYLPDFTKMTGITVAFDVPPYEPQHQKSMLDLSSGGAAYDIYMIDFPWLAEFLNTNNIQPVDDLISAEDPSFLSDMIPRLVDAGGRGKDGRLYGVANIGTTFGVVYRSDLFEQEAANYKAATGNDLKPPETWDEEIAIAKYFTQSLNPKSPTQYGIAMAGLPGNNAHNQFQFILWGVGGREVNEQYQATINNEKGVQAFTIVAELAKYAQPGLGGQSFDDMNNAFKLGKAVMQHNVTEYLPPDEADDSPVNGKMAYAWTPGHAPEIGGWSFLINSKSKNVNAAWEFVRWACGPEIAKPLTLAGGTVPRISAMTDPAVVQQFPWFPLLMEQFKVVQNRLSACPTCPGLIPEAQYELQVGTEVSNALTGNKTPKQAADDAAKALTKLMKDFGYAT
jgi:ABC-type glycerol-3-phosphate transport system substrate-binding protein